MRYLEAVLTAANAIREPSAAAALTAEAAVEGLCALGIARGGVCSAVMEHLQADRLRPEFLFCFPGGVFLGAFSLTRPCSGLAAPLAARGFRERLTSACADVYAAALASGDTAPLFAVIVRSSASEHAVAYAFFFLSADFSLFTVF